MKAFPTPAFTINDEARVTSVGGEGGMDLRDYFAANAMQSFLIGAAWTEEEVGRAAKVSYMAANAMMKERGHD